MTIFFTHKAAKSQIVKFTHSAKSLFAKFTQEFTQEFTRPSQSCCRIFLHNKRSNRLCRIEMRVNTHSAKAAGQPNERQLRSHLS